MAEQISFVEKIEVDLLAACTDAPTLTAAELRANINAEFTYETVAPAISKIMEQYAALAPYNQADKGAAYNDTSISFYEQLKENSAYLFDIAYIFGYNPPLNQGQIPTNNADCTTYFTNDALPMEGLCLQALGVPYMKASQLEGISVSDDKLAEAANAMFLSVLESTEDNAQRPDWAKELKGNGVWKIQLAAALTFRARGLVIDSSTGELADERMPLCKWVWTQFPSITQTLTECVIDPLTVLYTKIVQSVDGNYGVLGCSNVKDNVLGVNTLVVNENGQHVNLDSYGNKANLTAEDTGAVGALLNEVVNKALKFKAETFNNELFFDKNAGIRSAWHLYHINGYFPTYCKDGMVCSAEYADEKTADYRFVGNMAEEDIIPRWTQLLTNDIYSEFFTYLYNQAGDSTEFFNCMLSAKHGDFSQNTKLRGMLAVYAYEYAAKTSSIFFVRSMPADSGVFWLQYMYATTDGKNYNRNAGASLCTAFKDLEKLANSAAINMNGANKGARLLHNGPEADSALNRCAVYTALLVNDADLYINKPIFSYKPIEMYRKNGVPLDAHNILLGRTLTNADFKLNFDDFDVMTIYATSRAGKGVMTLSALAYLMASGIPVAYADAKPDMAGVMWKLQKEFGVERGLALEFKEDVNTGTETSLEWFGKAGIKSMADLPAGMREYATWQKPYNNLDIFYDTFGVTEKDMGAADSGSYLGFLAYTKFFLLLYSLRNAFSEPVTVVMDELDSYFIAGFTKDGHKCFIDAASKLAMAYVEAKNEAKSLEGVIKNAKKEEDRAAAEAKYQEVAARRDMMSHLVTNYKTISENATTKAVTADGPSTVAAMDRELKAEADKGAIGNLKLILIGQNYDTLMGWNNPSEIEKMRTMSALRKFVTCPPVYNRTCIVQGNFEAPECRQHFEENLLTGKSCEEYKTAAVDNSYLHVSKFGTSGFWAILPRPNSAKVSITKSYLVLNDNDYYAANPMDKKKAPYTGGLLERLRGNIAEVTLNEDIAPAGIKRDAVGFVGMMKLICNGDTSKVKESLSKGYSVIWDAFSKTKLCKDRGYTCLEQFIYDFHPESFKLDYDIVGDGAPRRPAQGAPTQDRQPFTGGYTNFGDAWSSQDAQNTPPAGSNTNPPAGNNTNPPASDAQNTPPVGGNTNPPAGDSTNPPVGNNAKPSAGNNTNPFTQGAWMQTSDGAFRQATPEEVKKMQEMQEAAAGMGGNTAEKSDESTRGYSAYDNSDAEAVSFGKEGNSPFAVYQKEGSAVNNALLRDEVTKQLVKAMSHNFGGLGAIYSFAIDNGMLVINGKKYAPKLPEDEIKLAPKGMQGDLAAGKYAVIFHFGYLRKMPNLISVSIDDKCLAKFAFWRDLGVVEGNLKKLTKRLPHLEELKIGGVDYFGELSDEEERTLTKEQKKQLKEERSEKAIKGEALRNAGSNVAGFLANIMGLPTSTADEHPIAHAFGQSRFARAVRHGALGAGSIWLGSMLIGLASPWVLLGGIIGAGSFIMQSHNRDDRDNYYSGGRPDKDITPRRTKNKYNRRKRNGSNHDDYSAFNN